MLNNLITFNNTWYDLSISLINIMLRQKCLTNNYSNCRDDPTSSHWTFSDACIFSYKFSSCKKKLNIDSEFRYAWMQLEKGLQARYVYTELFDLMYLRLKNLVKSTLGPRSLKPRAGAASFHKIMLSCRGSLAHVLSVAHVNEEIQTSF